MRIATTWTYPDGTSGHMTLPQTWGQVSGITPRNAGRYGFIRTSERIPDPPPAPKEYSKLRLYDALCNAGIWTDVQTAIQNAGQWDRWELANDLSTDYEPFALLLAQLRQTYGDELTDAILAAAEI